MPKRFYSRPAYLTAIEATALALFGAIEDKTVVHNPRGSSHLCCLHPSLRIMWPRYYVEGFPPAIIPKGQGDATRQGRGTRSGIVPTTERP